MVTASSIIKVHCFDPGITTGYATGLIENGKMGVVSGQMKWSEFELYNELKRSKPDIIVYETFMYRNNRWKKKHDNVELFPRNLIGVISMYVSERAASGTSIGCYPQSPAKGIGGYYKSAEILQKHNVYKIANVHANDAMRHLLTWYMFGAGFKYNKEGFYPLA